MQLLSIGDFRTKYREALKAIYPINEADSIFTMVVEDIVGLSRIEQLQNPDHQLNRNNFDKLENVLVRLQKQEPVQYILGKAFFYGLVFKVNPSVLIPRQETELLVETLVKHPFAEKAQTILDIGTGSGCIAISLMKKLFHAKLFGLDISLEAIEIAKENARFNGVDINYLQADILSDNLGIKMNFDIIVSNPPYVREMEMQLMHDNVTKFEPHLALFVPDNNALIYYNAIVRFSKEHLNSGGIIAFEINEAFGNDVKEILVDNSFYAVEIIKDLNEKNRILIGYKK